MEKEEYYVVEAWSTDPDGPCQIYFLKSQLSRSPLVRLLSFASSVKELRLLFKAQVTESGSAVRSDRYFVRISNLLDPKRFLDDKEDVLWSLLDKGLAEQLVHEWMDDPAYSRSSTIHAGRSPEYYYRNRVDAFASLVSKRWPEAVKSEKRGRHGIAS